MYLPSVVEVRNILHTFPHWGQKRPTLPSSFPSSSLRRHSHHLYHLPPLLSDVNGAVERPLSLLSAAPLSPRAASADLPSASSAARAAGCEGGERQALREDLAEGLTKLRVKDGVDDGVEGRVGVAQPRQDLATDERGIINTSTWHEVIHSLLEF